MISEKRKKLIKNLIIEYFYKLFFHNRNKIKLRKNIIKAFNLKEILESFINKLVVIYYDGKHPKHYLWARHFQFIIDNINLGDKVLDIGCGESLSYSQQLASKVDFLDAIDNNKAVIQNCIKKNRFNNIFYSVLDITKKEITKHYDVVILSHILEHLYNPEELLKKIKNNTKKIIVRLPRFDNHWMTLVKKDLGIFYFKDPDHKTEYTLETAINLIENSGWNILKAINDIDVKIVAISK